MFIWKYINLPEDELLQLLIQCRQVLPNNQLFFQRLDTGITHFLSMPLRAIGLVQVPPEAISNIHIDTGKSALAINIPLENCKDSTTSFWESLIPPTPGKTPNGHTYSSYDKNFCKKITEYTLDGPILLNTSVPHEVINNSNKWRKAISLRFLDDPWNLTE